MDGSSIIDIGTPTLRAAFAALAAAVAFLFVGFQGFRVLVELLLHRGYREGILPVQMSYSGQNWDVATGISALALAAWLATGRRSRTLVAVWNALGFVLLLNAVRIALLSAPTPLRTFMNEPSTTLMTRVPWVWLPTILVLAALLGHFLVVRKLLLTRDEPLVR